MNLCCDEDEPGKRSLCSNRQGLLSLSNNDQWRIQDFSEGGASGQARYKSVCVCVWEGGGCGAVRFRSNTKNGGPLFGTQQIQFIVNN